MKKININYSLLLGIIIVIFVLFIAMYGEHLAPFDPYGLNPAKVFKSEGDIEPNTPPNDVNIFGTDYFGRDVFSQILYGAKYTIYIGLFVVLFRFLIALPIAFFAGFGGKISGKIIDLFDKMFSTLPALFFSIFLLSLSPIKNLEIEESMIAFIVVLTIVGWGRLAKIIKNQIQDILERDFINGEVAIGKGKILIAIQNVLPHLLALLMIYAFLEMGRALILVGQLGVFQVFVGNSDKTLEVGDFTSSYDPEWGGLLSSSLYAIMTRTVWVAIFPMIAFFISVLGFNLLGEGLKIEINKRNSKFISHIRKIPFYISPITFIHEIKHFKENKKPISIKVGVIMTLIIILLVPPPRSLYKINSDELFAHVKEFSKDEYEGRMIGTDGRNRAAQYIVSQLEMHGVKPLFNSNYISKHESTVSLCTLNSSKLTVIGKDDDNILELIHNKDYIIVTKTVVDTLGFKEFVKGKILTEAQYKKRQYDKEKKYVLISEDMELDAMKVSELYKYLDFIEDASKKDFIVGAIISNKSQTNDFINRNKDDLTEAPEKNQNHTIVIQVNGMVGKQLRAYAGEEIVLKNDIEYITHPMIWNIGGIIKSEEENNLEPIIIATNYDYLGYEGDVKYKGLTYNATSVASALEIAKGLMALDSKFNRDIIFLFFDGSRYHNTGANAFVQENFRDENDIVKNSFVIRLNNLGLVNNEKLYIDRSHAETNNQENYEYIRYIKKRAEQLKINLKATILVNEYYDDDIKKFMSYGGKGVVFKEEVLSGGQQVDLNQIDKEKLGKCTQLILDTIIKFAYKSEK